MDERTLNDLLECSVCLERLNLNSKVLPCQHTFCRKCLEVIVSSQGSLRCPECRVLVDMKIDELPPNVLLMRILEGMKNASHNQINAAISSQNELPLLDLSQQPLNHSNLINNRASDEQNIIQQPSSTSTKKNPNTTVPHAIALYDYGSKENGDISFKKGDHIILRKRIDCSWFVGELACGRQGVFPINHVQVIVPLPQAQCKALYDFRMGPSEEEGCLTFKKGAIINVFRRVDNNWAEGRIADVIGIFPIAFVEMNPLAKTLMEIVPQSQFAQTTRTVPPTPLLEPISSTESSSTMSTPNSSPSNTSSTSSTTPSSPTNNLLLPMTVSTKPHENKSNRHSMINVLNPPANTSQRVNRHSAEILTVPKTESNGCPAKPDRKPTTSRYSDGNHKSERSSKVTAVIPSLPATYVALYPYKPQKADELELKKGSIYFVTERCQDGWFKGSNRAHRSGVFPGNYVTPLRSTHREYNQISNLKRQEKQKSSHSSQSSSHKSTIPPELPPRRNGTIYGSVWSKPLGNVETFFNRKSDAVAAGGSSQSAISGKDKKETSSSAVSLMKRITNMKRSKSPSNNTSAATYSMDNPVFEDISSSPPPGPSSSSKRNLHMSHPVHVRSGSCPSQLLHSLPIDIHSSNSAEPTVNMFGSQRLKGHKERPSLHGVRSNFEANRLRGLTENVADNERHAQMTATNQVAQSQHRKSQSLDAATISSQITTNGAKSSSKTNHNSSMHRERFRCIVPYPPNSEFELELNVGDIVFVHKKRDNGWFKGSLARTGKMGLFPASFVEPDN